jgi:hypothetical protein
VRQKSEYRFRSLSRSRIRSLGFQQNEKAFEGKQISDISFVIFDNFDFTPLIFDRLGAEEFDQILYFYLVVKKVEENLTKRRKSLIFYFRVDLGLQITKR